MSRPSTYTTPVKHDVDEPTNVRDVTIENLRIMEEAEEEMDSLSILPKQHFRPRRPENPRSITEPTPAALLHGWFKEKESLHDSRANIGNSQRRNRSPYSRSHLRSRSTGASALSAPLMARAHSLPNPSLSRPLDSCPSSGTLSPSPLRGSVSPRTRSPFKPEEAPRSPIWLEAPNSTVGSGIEAIQEDSELDITPRSSQAFHQLQPQQSPMSSRSNSLRSSSGGRRPPSPLHSLGHTTSAPSTSFPANVIDQHAPLNMSMSSASASGSNSPALGPQKYNEAYPFANHFHSSTSTSSFSSFSFNSHPSTPTSARSRSPSISSLETIEDAPEQESEAEAAIAQLKLAAAQAGESESDGEGEPGRRRSLDAPRARRAGAGGEGGRKRWSICGGERRADLDLETIWED